MERRLWLYQSWELKKATYTLFFISTLNPVHVIMYISAQNGFRWRSSHRHP